MVAKILLADDSITIQKVVGIIFASEEYDLSIVDNGTAALAKVGEIKPDVLLLDAVMPGLTGYEVCEKIRRDPELQEIPILLLTGAFEPFDENKARESGADDFISKPFESQNLIDKVLSLIDLGRHRKTAQPAPQSVPTPAAVISPPAQDFFDEVPAASPAPVAVPQAQPPAKAIDFAVEMVEMSPEDDLWGAFELEEVAEGDGEPEDEDLFADNEVAYTTEVIDNDSFGFAEELDIVAAGSASVTPVAFTGEEPFSFIEDGPEIMPEEPAGRTVPPGLDNATAFEEDIFEVLSEGPDAMPDSALAVPAGDYDFGYDTDVFEVVTEEPGTEPSPAGAEPTADDAFGYDAEVPFEVMPADEYGDVFAAESLTDGGDIAVQEPDQIFDEIESLSADLPMHEEDIFGLAEQQSQPEVSSAAIVSSPAPATAQVVLSDQQIADLVSRISRELIEKIAWEVVPDLAERIIREEIRKIKEGS